MLIEQNQLWTSRCVRLIAGVILLLFAVVGCGKDAPEGAGGDQSIAAVTAKSEVKDGFFKLLQQKDDGKLFLVLSEDQLGQAFIHTMVIQDGVVDGGHFRGQYRDNKILELRRHFNKIEFVEPNTSYYFDPTNPLSKASDANMPPAILAVETIIAEDEVTGEILIALDSVLLHEKLAQVKPTPDPKSKPGERFGLGKLNNDRSKIVAAKSYPENTSVVVDMVYENPAPAQTGGDDVTDSRAMSVVLQHMFLAMPENDFQPRFDDYRIGYFSDRVTELTSRSETPYRDMINRWHLVKKDPTAAVSDPVEPITWWIENTTPYEFRDLITEAALSWNSAFEKAGFSNAIAVQIQPDDADWDAGDIRYNVLRWTASPEPPFGGYGPSFTNPKTGQIIGADIMLEFSFLTNRLRTQAVLQSLNIESETDLEQQDCQLGNYLHLSNLYAREAVAMMGDPDQQAQLTKDSIYMLILHEIGHTLGLTHNMRASQLQPDPFDLAAVERDGLSGSVMDYEAVNVAPPGKTQTWFYQKKPGAYDDWAIEFGYSAALDDATAEAQRLAAILARSAEPQLVFGNDADDMRSSRRGIDPHINIGDMSSDAVGFAIERLEQLELVRQKMLAEYDGESYQRLYNHYLVLMSQYARSARVITRYVGGVHLNRLPPGSSSAAPYRPVERAQQERAMAALAKHFFASDVLEGSAALFAHLQQQRRGFDFFSSGEDPKIHEMLLRVQNGALTHLLHPNTLQRLTDSARYGNEYSALEMITDLTDAIFSADMRSSVNSYRQNLQIEYVTHLIDMVRGKRAEQYDHVAKSAILFQLKQLQKTLGSKRRGDNATRAHTQHLVFLIDRALAINA